MAMSLVAGVSGVVVPTPLKTPAGASPQTFSTGSDVQPVADRQRAGQQGRRRACLGVLHAEEV